MHEIDTKDDNYEFANELLLLLLQSIVILLITTSKVVLFVSFYLNQFHLSKDHLPSIKIVFQRITKQAIIFSYQIYFFLFFLASI